MINVLFVCLGNICRSPMAEAVMKHKVERAGLQSRIAVDSAGTGDWHIGQPPHEGTRRLLDEKKISWTGMQARQYQQADYTDYQYIIAMDRSNRSNLLQMSGTLEGGSHVYLFMDLISGRSFSDVPDPYYTGNFQEVYDLVDEGCSRLLEMIRQQHQL